ncbi:MAG: glycoside hydrolase family 99-like domain-containing protein [Clostridia bacterium]|nr:glycoside hydrolase family 99-like domain-containing protein [Clostridia bacterium]
MAKEYVDTHPNLRAPLITVNSWNEWTETSYLLPDDLYGYGYLEAIKRVFVDEQ